MSAYVEVIFDNTDGRFHNNGKPEFVLRRTIGAKKDEYSMDRKNATKREVNEMLEAAGLSRSNPFYIVPQGRVTKITNMKDEERLNLLKEISGSTVYEKRRGDSLKLLSDTDKRCDQIDELVQDINTRLQELEGEKKELEAWNKNDRERRALLYTINARTERDLEAQIQHIDDLRNSGVTDVDAQQAEFIQNEQRLEQLDTQINELKSEAELLRADRTQLEDERKKAARDRAAVELELSHLTDGQSAAQQAERHRETAFRQVQQQIETRESELSQLLPEHTAKKEEEMAVRSQLTEADAQQKRLLDKQGRTASYANKRQRDDALQRQIDEITVTLARKKSVQMQTDEDARELQKDIGTLEKEIARLNAVLEGESDNTMTLAEQVQNARDAQDAIRNQQSSLFRDDARLSAQVDNAEKSLRSAEDVLSHLMDHATSRGLQTLRRLKTQHNLDGIHGTVAELLEVPEPYKIATEVAAGPSLFHVVCDNDNTASKVIELLNKERGGRLTMIALNRVQARTTEVPQTADAQPLLPKLRYDPIYEKAIRHIFGKVIVCPELSICQSLVRTHDVLALTPDGDRANKKGGYHGGYFDPSKSKLDAHRKVADLRERVEELRTRQAEVQSELETLRQRLTTAVSDVRKAEYQRNNAGNSYGPTRQEVRTKQTELQRKRKSLEEMQRNVAEIALEVNVLGSEQSDLQAEIGSDFKKALSRDEEQALLSLTSTVRDLNRQLSTLVEERTVLESRKEEIEGELRENLRPHLDQLHAQQNGADGSGNQSTRLKECQRSLKNINKTVTDFDRRIRELENQRDEANTRLTELEELRDSTEKSNRELARAMEKQHRGMEKSLRKKAEWKEELAQVQREIRELGTLPDEAYHKYNRWSLDKVSELITPCYSISDRATAICRSHQGYQGAQEVLTCQQESIPAI